MKVYCVDYFHNSLGHQKAWDGNMRDARKTAREVSKTHSDDVPDKPTITPINIPTDKAGLLRWLNAHCDSDNG